MKMFSAYLGLVQREHCRGCLIEGRATNEFLSPGVYRVIAFVHFPWNARREMREYRGRAQVWRLDVFSKFICSFDDRVDGTISIETFICRNRYEKNVFCEIENIYFDS